VNLCSHSGSHSLDCYVGTIPVFRKLYRITQSSGLHRTESVSVVDYELTMRVSSTGSDQKQQNIFVRISLFWSVALQGHHVQRNGGDHDWLIQTPVSIVQWGMLVRLGADTCTPGHTLCTQFSAERASPRSLYKSVYKSLISLLSRSHWLSP